MVPAQFQPLQAYTETAFAQLLEYKIDGQWIGSRGHGQEVRRGFLLGNPQRLDHG